MPKHTTNRVTAKWIVDPACDAYGNWTIRVDDGSVHGDTEEEPVATVYGRGLADHIVSIHNKVRPVHA